MEQQSAEARRILDEAMQRHMAAVCAGNRLSFPEAIVDVLIEDAVASMADRLFGKAA